MNREELKNIISLLGLSSEIHFRNEKYNILIKRPLYNYTDFVFFIYIKIPDKIGSFDIVSKCNSNLDKENYVELNVHTSIFKNEYWAIIANNNSEAVTLDQMVDIIMFIEKADKLGPFI